MTKLHPQCKFTTGVYICNGVYIVHMNEALVTVMVLRRFQAHSVLGYFNMYGVYLFNMLFTKLLLTQILEILMVNKLL